MRKLGDLELDKVHQGYCPDALKQLPDECIQTAITSPPYWGLRQYEGVQPQIWGGASDCEHEWLEEKKHPKGSGGPSEKQLTNPGSRFEATVGKFCSKCGAWSGCLGLEPTPELYVDHLVEVCREVRRVLRKNGILWVNIGDSYLGGGRGGQGQCGHGSMEEERYESGQKIGLPTGKVRGYKKGDMAGVPWALAFALRDDGWWLKQDIIWEKPSPMPESVTIRCTRSHEYVFMFAKSDKYYHDHIAIQEDATATTIERYKYGWHGRTGDKDDAMTMGQRVGNTFQKCADSDLTMGEVIRCPGKRNKRSVWRVNTASERDSHFAVFPEELIIPMIDACTSEHGACAKCGAPYERILEQVNPNAITSGRGDLQAEQQKDEGRLSLQRPTAIRDDNVGYYETIGWKKTCECECEEVVPCVVLDPFAGSGTTIATSIKRGRNAIGFDASEVYVGEIAKYKVEKGRTGLSKAEQKAGQKWLFD